MISGASHQHCDNPVMVLGCSWRCGSTLLQRLLNSTGEIFIWGEHYGFLIPLLQSLAQIDRERNLSDRDAAAMRSKGHFAWIANLNPQRRSIPVIRAALNAMYGDTYAVASCPRWGFKEVRYSWQIGRAFLAAFPAARILFLTRSIEAVLASVSGVSWSNKVGGPQAVAQTWYRNISSFLDVTDERVLQIRYEDLVAKPGATLPLISNHIAINAARFDTKLLSVKVGGSGATLHPSENVRPIVDDPRIRSLSLSLGYG